MYTDHKHVQSYVHTLLFCCGPVHRGSGSQSYSSSQYMKAARPWHTDLATVYTELYRCLPHPSTTLAHWRLYQHVNRKELYKPQFSKAKGDYLMTLKKSSVFTSQSLHCHEDKLFSEAKTLLSQMDHLSITVVCVNNFVTTSPMTRKKKCSQALCALWM